MAEAVKTNNDLASPGNPFFNLLGDAVGKVSDALVGQKIHQINETINPTTGAAIGVVPQNVTLPPSQPAPGFQLGSVNVDQKTLLIAGGIIAALVIFALVINHSKK